MASRDIEQILRTTDDEAVRTWAFAQLAKDHADEFVPAARKRAAWLGLGPQDADVAVSKAFIRIASTLHRPWPSDRSFMERFERQIWGELMHLQR